MWILGLKGLISVYATINLNMFPTQHFLRLSTRGQLLLFKLESLFE